MWHTAHTGFTLFEKGILWREQMYVFPRFPSAIFRFIPLKRSSLFDSDKLLGTGLFNVKMCAYYGASFDCLYAQLLQRKKSMEDRASRCVWRHTAFFLLFIRTHTFFRRSQGRQIARPFFRKDCVSNFDTFNQMSAKALNLVLQGRFAAVQRLSFNLGPYHRTWYVSSG